MNKVQQTLLRSPSVNSNLLTIPLQSLNTFSTISTTNGFNAQCNEFVTHLGELSRRYNTLVRKAVALDPTYTGSRSKGVKLAWKYERADIEMGGEVLPIGISLKDKKYEKQEQSEEQKVIINVML